MIPSKENGSYTGFLSTRPEIHSFALGLYAGMRDFHARPGKLPDNDDVQKEQHYYAGAYVIGTVLQLIVCATFLLAFIPW